MPGLRSHDKVKKDASNAFDLPAIRKRSLLRGMSQFSNISVRLRRKGVIVSGKLDGGLDVL